MMKRFLLLGLLSIIFNMSTPIVMLALSDEEKTGELQAPMPDWDLVPAGADARSEEDVAKLKATNDELFSAPGWGRMLKSTIALAGPAFALYWANRKLKKDRNARKIKLKEQQMAQGGANPMAQLMMMMQGGGGAGFPTAEVRQPALGTPGASDAAQDAAKTSAENAPKPEYEKDILTTSMRRFWLSVSWICSAMVIYNGFGFANNVGAQVKTFMNNRAFNAAVAKAKEDDEDAPAANEYPHRQYGNLPMVVAGQENKYRSAWNRLDKIFTFDKASNDPEEQMHKAYALLAADEELKEILETQGNSEKNGIDTVDKANYAKEANLIRARQLLRNVRGNSREFLKNNWFARAERFFFGHDAGSRLYMHLNRSELKKTNADDAVFIAERKKQDSAAIPGAEGKSDDKPEREDDK